MDVCLLHLFEGESRRFRVRIYRTVLPVATYWPPAMHDLRK